MTQARKRVLIVDDHPLYREGLRNQLEQHGGFEVVAEAEGFEKAQHLAKKFKPDVVLLDISLPDGSGVELARELRALAPEIRILMLSMHSRVDFITAAFQAGAAGYMAKESSADQILKALEVVAAGGQYLDGALSPKVLRRLNALNNAKAKSMDVSYNSLSLREQQVMRLLAEGLAPQEIADKLFITRKTVENHRHAIMRKLDLKSPLAFVRHAARLGLISLDEDEE